MVVRLSPGDWVEKGLKSLAEDGHQTLRPERLAKMLGVSRGSFYWHFTDVHAFERAVLEKWALVAVEVPYEQAVTGGGSEQGAPLAALIRRAFGTSDALERSVRAWAGIASMARDVVSRVDDRRVELLAGLMPCSSEATARARAVTLYWTYLGHVTVPELKADDAVIAVITAMYSDRPRGGRR